MAKGRKIPEVLTPEEQEAILDQPNLRYPTGERNRAFVRLLLDTGLRVSEAINLRWRDIDLNIGKLMVRQGKGAKDRTLWIREDTLEVMRDWRERQAQAVDGPTKLVFTTLKGKKLYPQYLRQLMDRLAEKAGIEKKISPHTMRHTFATDLYRETKNIRLVQKALGHSDLSTTMIYTHIVDDELEEALKNFRKERVG